MSLFVSYYCSSFKVWFLFSFRIFGGSIFISGSCFVILAFTMKYSRIIVFVIRFIQGFVEVGLNGINRFVHLFGFFPTLHHLKVSILCYIYLNFKCRAYVSQQWVLLCRLGPRNLSEPELLDCHIQVHKIIFDMQM